MNTRIIEQILLYEEKFTTERMTIPQKAKVIQIGINYCGDVQNPYNLSDDTVRHVLEKAGFDVSIANQRTRIEEGV